MATATPTLSPIQQRMRNPLQRLRGYLRTYVTLEGLASFCHLPGAVVLDRAAARLRRLQDCSTGTGCASCPCWFRAVLLVGLAGAAVTLALRRSCRRLIRQFRDSAFALLLERKFPALLGDRLITAVELSDPEAAAALGYSPAMIRETINEAARRRREGASARGLRLAPPDALRRCRRPADAGAVRRRPGRLRPARQDGVARRRPVPHRRRPAGSSATSCSSTAPGRTAPSSPCWSRRPTTCASRATTPGPRCGYWPSSTPSTPTVTPRPTPTAGVP